MATTGFDDLVRREHAHLENSSDWQREKNEWLQYLDELYVQLGTYLNPYVEKQQVSLAFSEIELQEEQVGRYLAKQMAIDIGMKRIELKPVGTFLIGSKGRVDVLGPIGRARILLVNSKWKSLAEAVKISVKVNGELPSAPPGADSGEIKWAWRIVTRPPAREIIEINRENFLNLLVEVSDGKDF